MRCDTEFGGRVVLAICHVFRAVGRRLVALGWPLQASYQT